ncbi:MAG: APC family permease [Polyangiaceae bacterium]
MSDSQPSRPLGFGSLLALGVNGIVGVGIFFIPADLARFAPGYGSVGLLAMTALALSPIVLVYALLAARFDEDGGPVLYARAAFGDTVGFFVGWLAYLSAIASTSAVIFNLSLRGLWPALAPVLSLDPESSWGPRLLAISITLALAALCSRGLKLSARAWSTLTVLKLIPLLALVSFGALKSAPPTAASASPSSWAQAMLVAVFVFQGFEIVPVVAGRASRASKSVPVAMLAAVGLSALLYMALQLVAVRAVPDLSSSRSPLVDVGQAVGGGGLATLIRLGTNISALGIAIGMVTMTPWYLATAAKHSLGAGLADVSELGVPRRALAVTTVLVVVLVSMGSNADLFALSSLAVVIQYLTAALALLVLAKRSIVHVLVSSIAAVLALLIASGASSRELLVASVGVVLGLITKLALKPAAPSVLSQ